MACESFLDEIHIATPCHASWAAMEGDERARFCAQCQKHVYNLSGMGRGEAEALIRQHEWRLCVRYYLRPDGTVLTDDCPVALRAARRWLLARMTGTAALLGGLLALCVQNTPLGRLPAFQAPEAEVRTPSPPTMMMGSPAPLPMRLPPPHMTGRVSFLRDPPIIVGGASEPSERPAPPER